MQQSSKGYIRIKSQTMPNTRQGVLGHLLGLTKQNCLPVQMSLKSVHQLRVDLIPIRYQKGTFWQDVFHWF